MEGGGYSIICYFRGTARWGHSILLFQRGPNSILCYFRGGPTVFCYFRGGGGTVSSVISRGPLQYYLLFQDLTPHSILCYCSPPPPPSSLFFAPPPPPPPPPPPTIFSVISTSVTLKCIATTTHTMLTYYYCPRPIPPDMSSPLKAVGIIAARGGGLQTAENT